MPRKKAYVPQRMDRGGVWLLGCGTAEDWEEANDQILWMQRWDLTTPLQTQEFPTMEVVYRTQRPPTDYQRTEAARDETLREIATWFWSELEKEGLRCISMGGSTNFKRRLVLAKDGNRAEVELSSSDFAKPAAGVKKLAQQLQQFFLEHPSSYVHPQSQESRAAALEKP